MIAILVRPTHQKYISCCVVKAWPRKESALACFHVLQSMCWSSSYGEAGAVLTEKNRGTKYPGTSSM